MSTAIQCQVEGMTCGNCALSIQKYLDKQGATHVVVNAATGEVNFQLEDENKKETLFDGIDSLGYHVLRKDEHQHVVGSSIAPYLIICILLWIPLMSHMFIAWAPLHNPIVQCGLALPVYLIGAYYFGRSAFRSLQNGIPNMDVLVFIGSSAAFIYSLVGWYLHPEDVHQYLFFETTASIITLVLAGNYLEEYAVRSTTTAMRSLMSFQKAKAKIVWVDSIGKETIQEIDNEFVKVDDIIQVNAGDKIPIDGMVLSGNALIDESMMTGESIPVNKEIENHVIGGTLLVEGNIRMKATAVGKNTALAQIIKLVNEAQAIKPPLQRLADRISVIFIPSVLAIAVITFIINFWFLHNALESSIMRSIAVMVIACPCAMGLATPAAVMVGLGRAAKLGILIKGGDTLEKFKDIKQFVFDKTGTLTTGKLNIHQFYTDIPEQEFKSIVFSLEQHSSHPIAKSICKNWHMAQILPFQSIEELKGKGLSAIDQQQNKWQLGSYRLLPNSSDQERHDLYLTKNNTLVGWIDMKDELRSGAVELIQTLHAKNYHTVLLSGDRNEKCKQLVQETNIEEFYGEQLPADKLSVLDKLMKKFPTAMVGDGINDAPSLTKADIGISLSDSSHIAMQSAQVILLNNNLNSLVAAIELGKKTYQTIKGNLFWAFFYNIVAIPFAASGYLTPTWGAAIMGLSDVVLILNSLRLRYRKIN